MKVAVVGPAMSAYPALCAENQWYDLRGIDARYTADIPYVEMLLESGDFTEEYFDALLERGRSKPDFEAAHVVEPSRYEIPLLPGKIVALGRNYAAHARELGNEVPDEPVIFFKSPTACIGDNEPIVVKPWYGRVDHEGEFAFVVGKRAKDVAEDRAREYVAGYTLLNDVTARDLQNMDKDRGLPWFRSKNLDTFCPIGPAICLPSEVGWPPEVDIELRVNGETRQSSNTRLFLFKIPKMLEYISRYMTLEPGDLVSTGTPAGVSPLAPGDIVDLRVSAIGTLRNPVELMD